MGKNRPIVVATLGYIIGIIWGLYFKTNIATFYVLIIAILIVAKSFKNGKPKRFKFISISKIFRYIKLILDFKSVILIILFSIISNLIIIKLNYKYENLYANVDKISINAKIVSNATKKDYKTTYKIKVEDKKYKSSYLYLEINKNFNIELKYGDYIHVYGEFTQPSKATNFKGFDYAKYLRTQKIYGTIKGETIQILREDMDNVFFRSSNTLVTKIKELVRENLEEEKANLLLGILFGYKEEITDQIQQSFEESNISHVLSVSGLHVSYIILAVTYVSEKIQGKRTSKIIVILFIIFYMFITNFAPSVVRASFSGIIVLFAKLIYDKSDIWTSSAISILCILIYNPYLITSASVLLSYGGTFGIILFQKNISNYFQKNLQKIDSYKYQTNTKIIKLIDYIKETISVSFAAQIFIIPIMMRLFNTVSASFFITNFFASLVMGPIMIVGFIFIISTVLFSNFFFKHISKYIIENLLELLIIISKMGEVLPLSQIKVATPNMFQILSYYLIIFMVNTIFMISNKRKKTAFEKRLINWKNLIKHLIRRYRKKVILVLGIIVVINCILSIIPKDLKVYFIDVGQGDSTLIVTPYNQTILIDGGGAEGYDVGKNILVPYLLDRKITKIDFIIISHADLDHIRTEYLLSCKN